MRCKHKAVRGSMRKMLIQSQVGITTIVPRKKRMRKSEKTSPLMAANQISESSQTTIRSSLLQMASRTMIRSITLTEMMMKKRLTQSYQEPKSNSTLICSARSALN